MNRRRSTGPAASAAAAIRRLTAVAGLIATAAFLSPALAHAQQAGGGDEERVLMIEHFVPVQSIAPGISGQTAQIHVRERVTTGTALRGADLSGRVVLFIHGAGTPAEVAFDTPYEDYSWMAFLAESGFDAFSMNVTGYGRSTRPPAMNDPCNLAEAARERILASRPIASPCAANEGTPVVTIESDWHDIAAVVEYIRALRGVESVSLVAWSLGGPRAGGFAARHPELVDRMVLLAPAYNRASAANAPASFGGGAAIMNVQSRADFDANWNRQVECENQYDPAVADIVWAEMLRSDIVGATWDTGVRRAPRTPTWGWNAETVGRTEIPTLIFAPVHDRQVPASRSFELHEDLGSTEKVLVDLGCSSHNAHWERNHRLMFEASLEWLTRGTVAGERTGILKMGY